ncbi:MAG: mandelate racemase/muconate lactonizing enzyme family protein [Chloroflexi bacterium]|nr:MAG: mandelate racemase/muconate lactonizing enzyme family protein [Chloroflexota bacterium]
MSRGSRIERAEWFVLTHSMSAPRGPSIWTYRRRECVLVKLTDSDGITGWGETYLEPGVTAAIAGAAKTVVARDPLAANSIWRDVAAASGSNLATSAMSIALDDLRARQLGMPLAGLYGGPVRNRVRAYASSAGYEVEGEGAGEREVDPTLTWQRDLPSLAAEGFRAIKLRVGRHPIRHELAAIETAMSRLPPGIELMADGNAAYTLPQAIEMGHGLERLGFVWFEEPAPQDGYAGYERIHDALDIALAGGEGIADRREAQACFERGIFDIVQPDVSICGGVGEAQLIADLAQLRGVGCVPHMWGGAIMLAATLQVLALLPDPTRSLSTFAPLLEYDTTENPFRTDLLTRPLSMVEGWFEIPSGPGLGVEPDEQQIRQRAVDSGLVSSSAHPVAVTA